MRIYRLSQAAQQASQQAAQQGGQVSQIGQTQPQQEQQNVLPQELIDQGQASLNDFYLQLGKMNESLSVLESSGIAQFMTRQGLINAMGSGMIQKINSGVVNSSFAAMQQLLQSAIRLKDIVAFFKNNPAITQALNQDVDFMTKIMTDAINSKNYQQFEGQFQEMIAQLDTQTRTNTLQV